MTFSLSQFADAFSDASAATQAALFTPGPFPAPSAIKRILTAHGITEPHVVAQFLTACGLASDGFTNFDKPGCQQCVREWLEERAAIWERLKLSSEAASWETELIVNVLTEHKDKDGNHPFEIAGGWSAIWRTLDAVCAALGIENRSEELALEDTGASEM